jgi:hypothetical protein
MQRRRLGLIAALLVCAALIAVKPASNELRLTVTMPQASDVTRVEAAVTVGGIALSVLIEQAERSIR